MRSQARQGWKQPSTAAQINQDKAPVQTWPLPDWTKAAPGLHKGKRDSPQAAGTHSSHKSTHTTDCLH